METQRARQKLEAYIVERSLVADQELLIFKSLQILDYSQTQTSAKMLVKCKILPSWLNIQGYLYSGCLVSIIDASSAAAHLPFVKVTTSVGLNTLILSPVSARSTLLLDISITRSSGDYFALHITVKDQGKIVAIAQHTKKYMEPKL